MAQQTNKRIAIVTGIAGRTSETFITRHIRELNGGNNVVVCSKVAEGVEFDQPVCELHHREKSKLPRSLNRMLQVFFLLMRGHPRVPNRKVTDKLIRFFRQHQVAVILTEFGGSGCMMQPVAEKAGIPIFSYFRGSDASVSLKTWNTRYSYRKLIPKTDGIIAVSAHLLKNLENIGVTHSNVHVIPSGVVTEWFVPGEKDENLLLSVGRLVKKKSPELTIRAFSRIAEKYPDVRLEIIGEGDLLELCQELVQTLGLSNRVVFWGAQPHEVVREKLSRAAIFLQHSVTTPDGNTEGLPTAIQEALSAGAVVISTRHGGIPDAVEEGVSGFLVDEFDLDSYVESIETVLGNPQMRREMSRHARERALDRFDSKKLLTKLENILFKNTVPS